MMRNFLLIITVAFLAGSCAKKKIEKQAEKDDEIIRQYLSDHNINATATGTGLYYLIEVQGAGVGCTGTSDVTVAYKGYLTDGAVFDQSDASGVTFNLQQVIKGWTEGIPYFKEGGSGKLFIPSALGYGDNQVGGIPPNSVLIFDVELIDVL